MYSEIAELIKFLPLLRDLSKRSLYDRLAVVTDNRDPDGQRRVRVSLSSQGGLTQSYWAQCGRSAVHSDEVLPEIGTTVLVGAVEGNPNELYVKRSYCNATNPPDPTQGDPVKDHTIQVPGNQRHTIGGDSYKGIGGKEERITQGDVTVTSKGDRLSINCPYGDIEILATDAGNEILIKGSYKVRLEQEGAYLEGKGGAWTFGNASGQRWTFGGAGGGSEWTWNVNGGSIDVTNCSGFAINGRDVIVVGSRDSDGDVNNQRGY
jgi:hypothetical protein